MKSTQRIFTCIFIAILYFAESYGYTSNSTYEFGKDCTVFIKHIDENDLIYVEYNGGEVEFYCNDVSFGGRGEDSMDDYEICVTPQEFVDPDCAVQLDYKASNSDGAGVIQSVTCSSNNNEKFCGASEDHMFIYFEKRDKKDTSNARLKLLIQANKVFDFGSFVGAIAGGVIGGIVFLSLVTGVVCYCVCRRKPKQGQVLNPGQTVQTPMIDNPANYQQPSMNPNSYPAANSATPYSAGYSTQPQPQSLPPDSIQQSN